MYEKIPDNVTFAASAAVSPYVLLVRHALVEDAGEADGEADCGAEEGDGHDEEAPLQPRTPVPPRHLLDLHVHFGGIWKMEHHGCQMTIAKFMPSNYAIG